MGVQAERWGNATKKWSVKMCGRQHFDKVFWWWVGCVLWCSNVIAGWRELVESEGKWWEGYVIGKRIGGSVGSKKGQSKKHCERSGKKRDRGRVGEKIVDNICYQLIRIDSVDPIQVTG